MAIKSLSPNWLTEGLIDFEYKKYLLLGYLKQIEREFDETRLYPFLGELVHHYESLKLLKEQKEQVSKVFPTKVSRIDLQKMTLEYEKMLEDEEFMGVIEQILEFALPRLQMQLKNGSEIYEIVDNDMSIEPIGIIPLMRQEGYLMIQNGAEPKVHIYCYQLTLFESAREKFRAIKTAFVHTYLKQMTQTFESIKLDLLRQQNMFANPATYLLHSKHSYPMQETFLPVAKRRFVRYLGQELGS